jgi:predicted Zn-dependent peptidase
MSQFLQHRLPGGMTLVAERMTGVQSAAMALLLPAGAATDPDGLCGSATVLSDLVLRGAGSRDSKELINQLDGLGLQRSSGAGVYHTHFSCSAVAAKVIEALPTYADIARRPKFPKSGFDAARDLALQALAGIDDEPRQKLLIALRERHFPGPLGRNPMGRKEDLESLTLRDCRDEHARRYCAGGAILAIAGNIDFETVKREAEKCFGDFEGVSAPPDQAKPSGANHHFEAQQSEQTHIGIAYPSVSEADPEYYTMCMAIEVLGGGMSGRLFTEVREKRGLVYNVSAAYSGLKGLGAILCYAGTSNDRAQATLECVLGELHRLSAGVNSAELERARIGLKAATIMQAESTGGRASGIAYDYFLRGRIRTLDEIKAKIDEVTLDRVNSYLKEHTPGPFTVVIVGPKDLKVPE